MPEALKQHSIRVCERRLERLKPHQKQARDGETWTCSCGRVWEHVCDEAEGCRWDLLKERLKETCRG